jgi:Protein of unknown function (DUF2934)
MPKPRVPKKAGEDTAAATPALDAVSSGVLAAESNGNGSATNGVKKTVRRKTAAKPEIVKSDLRATVVPINVEEEVRRLAYLMSERRGFEPGHEAEDWFAAEREVRQRYHQHSA